MKRIYIYIIFVFFSGISGFSQLAFEEITTTDVNCNSGSDGSITISVSGGSSPYFYYYQRGGDVYSSPLVVDTFYSFNSVSSNNWFVIVEDNNGDIISSMASVNQPDPISITAETVTPVSCNGDNDGTITISASGESGSYQFDIAPLGLTSFTGNFTGLGPDTYTVTVSDATGCSTTDVSGSLVVNEPLPISISSQSSTDISCSGSNDGSITITGTGGTGVLTYTLNPGATEVNTSGNFTGLAAGTYTVDVSDDNGCPVATSTPEIISEPAALIIDSESSSDVTCNGSDDGTITISATGGTGPYNYVLSPGSDSNSTGLFSGLQPGSYTVSVTDANLCGPLTSSVFVITEPDAISISSLTSSDNTCNGSNDGTINITATGGNPPLSYTLNPGATTNSTGSFTGLSADSYTVSINDASACPSVVSSTIVINDPPVITIDSEASSDATCNGSLDGTISVSASGGTGTLYYTLNPGAIMQTNGNFSGLGAGSYTVSVSDDNACPVATSNTLVISEPSALTIDSENTTNISCFGDGDGSITITASGGTGPYTFTLSPGTISNTTGIFNNLEAGSYTVEVQDAAACPSVTSSVLTISEPAVISVISETYTDISCNGLDNGEILVSGTGGTAPLVYTLNPGSVSNATGSFTGLSGGDYTVSIEDANACPSAVSSVITITDPDPITVFSQSSSDISCNGAADGSITVVGTGGTGSLEYTLTPGSITNSTGVFNGLSAGDYTVNIKDINGCPSASTGTITISEPAAISAVVDASSKLALDCYGDSDGNIDITVSGGTGPYSFAWTGPSSFTSTSEDISSLIAGTYSLVITDVNLCTATFTDFAAITEPSELTISLSGTDVTCNGDANGTITITAGGGTPAYEYSRNGISYQSSNTFTGLTQNTYNLFVRDANGCIVSDITEIDEPLELVITSEIRIDNNLCYGDSLGEIRILSVEGGITPYEYSIDGGGNYFLTSDFQNLPAGSYQTTVRDANLCIANGNLNVINQPNEIEILSYTQVDVSGCADSDNGQIAIEGSGGTGSKEYSIDGGTPNTTGIFNPVSGGPHTLTISDINSCSKDTLVNILTPPEISISSILITDVSGCEGNSNGEVSITASGGTGSLQYAIDGGSYQAGSVFTGLIAGSHTISLKDDNDCQLDTIISLSEPAALVIGSETSTDISCAGANDGSIMITATGGTAPYTYTLAPGGTINNSGVFNSLSADTYTVSVNDANGCGPVTSSSLVISEPAAIIIDSLITDNILCSGDDDGRIIIYVSGGTSPFAYSIDDGNSYQTDSSFTDLVPGTYQISVRDANACSLAIDTIIFTDPAPMLLTTELKTDVALCYGDSTGSIEYEISGGTGNIEYSIDSRNSWQSSGLYSNLPAGDYTVVARDSNQCELESSLLSISQPEEITAIISTTPQINESNPGTLSISSPSGGTGSLEYSINGTGGPFTSDTEYTGLTPGFYDVVIRDDNLCLYEESIEVEEMESLDVTVTITSASCYGLDDASIHLSADNATGIPEYSIDDSASWSTIGIYDYITAGEYIVFARDEDGRYFSDTVIVNQPVEMTIFTSVTPASCSNMTADGEADLTISGAVGSTNLMWSDGSTSEDRTDLSAGTYWVYAEDENGCTASDTILIPAVTNVTAFAGNDTSICFGESLILNGEGGTTMSWTPESGLSNPNIYNPVVDTDTSISYVLTVIGLNDCYDVDTINITVYPTYGLSAGNDTTCLLNESVSIETTGGPYVSYLWEPSTGVSDTTSPNPDITIDMTQNYIVSGLTSDGCYDRDTIMISLVENIIVYNAFSPNGDGLNDYWDIDYADLYPEIVVEVYSRWGEKYFSSVGYSDDKRWDGTYKGKDVPVGTYYYVVVPYSGASAITGPVTIVR